ncbi:MAG: AAA family ATPase [Ruminococcaceae bacterium]|nr:AAA family ATPase [Oscillospiraceae bacterium]
MTTASRASRTCSISPWTTSITNAPIRRSRRHTAVRLAWRAEGMEIPDRVRLEYRFAPEDRRRVEGMDMHDYVRTFFAGMLGEDSRVERDTERALSMSFGGVTAEELEGWALRIEPVIDLSPRSSCLIDGKELRVPDDGEDGEDDNETDVQEPESAPRAPAARSAEERRQLFRNALREAQQGGSRIESVMQKVEGLVAADAFKEYCRWLVTVMQSQDGAYLREYYQSGALCFAIGGGNGFTTYISLLAELFTATGLKTIEHRSHVQEIKKADTDAEVIEAFEHYADDSDLIAVDLGFRVDKAGTTELHAFLRKLAQRRGKLLPIFKIPYTTESEMQEILRDIGSFFPLSTIRIPPFLTENYAAYAASVFSQLGCRLDPDAADELERLIVEKRNQAHFYGFHSVRALAEDVVYHKSLSSTGEDQQMPLVITEKDLYVKQSPWEAQPGGLEALDEMVGVDEIKSRIDEIVVQLELASTLPDSERPCMHMLFTGNPGTGKTTVARILGSVLKEKGVLSKGRFYERTGRELVGKYIGETAPITNAICRDAYGSVLFIDEAYTLFRSRDDERDFGREALDTLLTQMENHRRDLIVIFSGYEDEMHLMLDANPGLASRIPHEIKFRSFTREELAKIYMGMAGKKYCCAAELAEAAERYFASLSDETLADKAFANARFVRNLYERTVSKAALRFQAETGARIDADAAIVLTAEDFRNAAGAEEFRKLQVKQTRAIGFA